MCRPFTSTAAHSSIVELADSNYYFGGLAIQASKSGLSTQIGTVGQSEVVLDIMYIWIGYREYPEIFE